MTLKTNQRLFLAVIPAVLGVLTVGALAYWGQYARVAPHMLIAVAAAAAIISLVMAWYNARYVALRIAQLAGKVSTIPGLDELDSIETVVDRHASMLAQTEQRLAAAQRDADARVHEHGELLVQLTGVLSKTIADIALPLHILLENRFGELNENQEEMLETARSAADVATVDTRRLAEIAELDSGRLTLRRDRIHLADLFQSLRPTIENEGARLGVRVESEVEPALPPVAGDRGRLQEALALLVTDCVRRAPSGGKVRLVVTARGTAIAIAIDVQRGTSPEVSGTLAAILARRLIQAQDGEVGVNLNGILITLPVARVP